VEDADVIGAFIVGMTNELLMHELGRNRLHSTWKLFDITMIHASGEEAIRANFSKDDGRADPQVGDRTSQARCGRSKKNLKRCDIEFDAAADRKGKQKMGRADTDKSSNNFEKKMEEACPNHNCQVKYLFKDYDLLK
jgi:hypothetical protein